jgi:hypothetical protein
MKKEISTKASLSKCRLVASGGNKVYEQFLGSISKQIWTELQVMWQGKSSLMDVIRAERKNNSS